MDMKLYKFEVIKGKEETAEEWLSFLREHKAEGENLLKREHAYLEAYFKSVENETMYIYMFFACEDVSFSNDKAMNEGSELDQKHFEYMQQCIDLAKGKNLDCYLFLDNLEALKGRK